MFDSQMWMVTVQNEFEQVLSFSLYSVLARGKVWVLVPLFLFIWQCLPKVLMTDKVAHVSKTAWYYFYWFRIIVVHSIWIQTIIGSFHLNSHNYWVIPSESTQLLGHSIWIHTINGSFHLNSYNYWVIPCNSHNYLVIPSELKPLMGHSIRIQTIIGSLQLNSHNYWVIQSKFTLLLGYSIWIHTIIGSFNLNSHYYWVIPSKSTKFWSNYI